jgi:preprotein translocase SecE subunit
VARDRQRAKQRQAERRAERLARTGESPAGPDATRGVGSHSDGTSPDGGANGAPLTDGASEVAGGAPPETLGRSDTVVAPTPGAEPIVRESEEPLIEEEAAGGVDAKERGRLVAFLVGVMAELRRVQWPNRTQLTSLTGVVLGFVLLAGGYLGLLDAVFSRLIRLVL